MLYDHKRVDNSLPFEELKRMSRINDVADQGPDEAFGDAIRRNLPTFQPR